MKKPALRFKGFDGDWVKKTFGDFGRIAMNRRIFKEQTSENGDIPFYKIGTFGADPDAYISRALFEEYKRKYPYPQKGDVLVSAAGSIGKTVEYDGSEAYFQDSNIVWLEHRKELSNKFLKYLYSIVSWNGLEGSTIKRLYNSNFLETSAFFPDIKEQNTIGSFFTELDSLIEGKRAKLDKLKKLKLAYLGKMFPKKGTRVPEVRFKGFSGDWVENLAKDICKIETGKSNTQDQVKDGKYPFFIRSDFPVKSDRYLYDCEAVITIGDGQIGKVFHYINGKFDLHQRCYKMAEFRKDVWGKFFYYFFSLNFYDRAMKMTAKATVDSVRLEMIADMPILYPKDIEEQQKIAAFFNHLDNLINLQQQELDKLANIKSACLSKMFA